MVADGIAHQLFGVERTADHGQREAPPQVVQAPDGGEATGIHDRRRGEHVGCARHAQRDDWRRTRRGKHGLSDRIHPVDGRVRAHADALVLVLVHFGPRGVLVLADAGQGRGAISSQVAQVELGVISVVGDGRRLVAGRQERRAQEARGLGAFQGSSEGLQLQDPQKRRQRPALRQPVEDGKVG